ncbi:hypothetical protein SASPL_121210 [Salvia splendens]|uniref:Myb/SANT-like domain-containing protein n=1 Tax=Salvia splendens TaxID=180675 RepID=A0A8X8XUH8_SALSN|nr:hypothetical protein SASPL_121210 [Salvia splendens]
MKKVDDSFEFTVNVALRLTMRGAIKPLDVEISNIHQSEGEMIAVYDASSKNKLSPSGVKDCVARCRGRRYHIRATYNLTVNAKMAIPSQSEFLYNAKWSPACDDALVDCLIILKGENNMLPTEFPSWILLTASDWIKNKACVKFSELELKERVDLLRTRYYTFKAVIRLRGAYWNQQTKAVVAPKESWDYMLKMNSFAGAYFYQEEPIWARLACLFGFDDVKVEGQKEVVVISDNTEEIHEDASVMNALGDGEDEVNSPAVFPGPKVRRKLFDDDPMPNDRGSSTDAGIDFIDLTSDGLMRPREEKGQILHQPPKPSTEGAGPSTAKSPRSSSCGSNSPMKWWPHICKRP